MQSGNQVGCWQVLFPGTNATIARAEEAPLVLRGTFGGTRILLLSDLSRAGQDALLESTPDLHADLVVAGLPNEGEPVCEALLDAIQPKIIVIADSEYPAARRASLSLQARLAQRNIPVIYTRTAGAVSIAADRSGWKLRTMDGTKIQSP
jgi:beta-lactamase superfamily II metal-dependent hydrolase